MKVDSKHMLNIDLNEKLKCLTIRVFPAFPNDIKFLFEKVDDILKIKFLSFDQNSITNTITNSITNANTSVNSTNIGSQTFLWNKTKETQSKIEKPFNFILNNSNNLKNLKNLQNLNNVQILKSLKIGKIKILIKEKDCTPIIKETKFFSNLGCTTINMKLKGNIMENQEYIMQQHNKLSKFFSNFENYKIKVLKCKNCKNTIINSELDIFRFSIFNQMDDHSEYFCEHNPVKIQFSQDYPHGYLKCKTIIIHPFTIQMNFLPELIGKSLKINKTTIANKSKELITKSEQIQLSEQSKLSELSELSEILCNKCGSNIGFTIFIHKTNEKEEESVLYFFRKAIEIETELNEISNRNEDILEEFFCYLTSNIKLEENVKVYSLKKTMPITILKDISICKKIKDIEIHFVQKSPGKKVTNDIINFELYWNFYISINNNDYKNKNQNQNLKENLADKTENENVVEQVLQKNCMAFIVDEEFYSYLTDQFQQNIVTNATLINCNIRSTILNKKV